jgi:hypothetical protein
MTCQPPLHRGVFLRGVVVGEQMQGRARGKWTINQTQERQPSLGPMARQAGGEKGALGHSQGGKEGRGCHGACRRACATPALFHG